jgi:recombination protein RecR
LSSFSSKILDSAVQEFSRMPGIGKRSALRLVLHLLKVPAGDAERLGQAILRLREEVVYCRICKNISDQEICSICSDSRRDDTVICVVEDVRDIIAIENTNQFRGKYHVLGGIISPMDGIGPADLEIQSLINRLNNSPAQEIIMALSATMEGDTTAYYIFKKIHQSGFSGFRFSIIARGVSVGDELEYADEVTLGRSILNRVPYENAIAK